MSRLAPHVLFAVRRAHNQTVRELDDARAYLQRTEETVAQARQHLAETTAQEAELRAALDAHIDATTAQVYRDALDAQRAPQEAPQPSVVIVNAPDEPTPLRDGIDDTRRPRESWEH